MFLREIMWLAPHLMDSWKSGVPELMGYLMQMLRTATQLVKENFLEILPPTETWMTITIIDSGNTRILEMVHKM